eukprot:scaffold1307_cov200-Pinguiococcus_pyrenoidosus.AAC.30
MPSHATLCQATPRHATPRHATPRQATPRQAAPSRVGRTLLAPCHFIHEGSAVTGHGGDRAVSRLTVLGAATYLSCFKGLEGRAALRLPQQPRGRKVAKLE